MTYAIAADLERFGIASDALATLPPTTIDAALDRASAVADEYLAQRFALPLAAWSEQLRAAVCAIAAHDLLAIRGYNPTLGGDEVARLRYEDAMRWLREVRDGSAAGMGLIDASPSESETRHGAVVSRRRRGW
ncbi:MAG: phage protein Gp36 family protein [Polyangiales bacterium]